jgi:hypothetical protein
MVWMFVSSKNLVIKLNHQYGTGTWNHLREVISAFAVPVQRKSQTSVIHHVKTKWEGFIYNAENEPSPNMESACSLTLDFPAFRSLRNKLYISHPVFCYSNSNRLDTDVSKILVQNVYDQYKKVNEIFYVFFLNLQNCVLYTCSII